MWYRQGAEKHVLMVSIGFVEVLPDSVSVLAQVAERAEDLDEARAEAGMKRAEEMLGVVPHEIDFERARLALLRDAAADAGGKSQRRWSRLEISQRCFDTAGSFRRSSSGI